MRVQSPLGQGSNLLAQPAHQQPADGGSGNRLTKSYINKLNLQEKAKQAAAAREQKVAQTSKRGNTKRGEANPTEAVANNDIQVAKSDLKKEPTAKGKGKEGEDEDEEARKKVHLFRLHSRPRNSLENRPQATPYTSRCSTRPPENAL
jgi:hypothetical protein